MVVTPKNPDEWGVMAKMLHVETGVIPGPDLLMFAWEEKGQIQMIVGFNGFVGKTAHIHVAMAPGFHFTPREMLRVVFTSAFNNGVEMLLGIVNSNNHKAMKYDLHLGFEELLRLPKMHDDGGDIVVLAMLKEDCKYLGEVQLAAQVH